MGQSKSLAPDAWFKQLIGQLWQDSSAGSESSEDWLLAMQTRIGEGLQNLLAAGLRAPPGTHLFATETHPAVLQVQLTPYQMTVGKYVRFRSGDRVFGEAEASPKGRVQWIASGLAAGGYRIACELLNRHRQSIASVSLPELRLEVLGQRPIVLLDDWIVRQRPSRYKRLEALAREHGFRWIAVDFGHKNAPVSSPTHKDTAAWPKLVVQEHASKFAQYDVDFRHVFLELAVRRLRSDGAPVLALVCHPDYANGDKLAGTLDVLALTRLRANPLLPKLAGQARKFVRAYQAADPLDWRIQQMTGTETSPQNHCAIECNNRKARTAVLKHINTAQRSVDLQTYIFKDGRFVSELSVALVKAAQRGVRVRILVDALWSRESFLGLSNPQLRQLASIENIEVHGVAPAALRDEIGPVRLKQRDHRKILVVDGAVAIVSGRNCGDEYYYDWRETPITDWTNHENIPWLDAHIEVQGPVVAQIQTVFNAQWQTTTGQGSAKPRRVAAQGTCTTRLVIHHGVDDANALAGYEAFIRGAQSHLYIVNDFPVVDRIAEALGQAVLRGVQVKFLTGCVLTRRMDGTFFPGERHREAFEYVIKSRFADLIAAGIDVYEYTTEAMDNIVATGGRVKPYVHAKLATVDGLAVNIGSANLDVSASFWEREANIIVQDPAFARSTERRLQRLLNRSWKIDLQSKQWKRETAPRNVIAGLWPDLHLS